MTVCIRCGGMPGDHMPGGVCLDGAGSFTWAVPSRPELIAAVRRIREAAEATGHPGLAMAAEDFLRDFADRRDE